MPNFENKHNDINFVPEDEPTRKSVKQQLFDIAITQGKTIVIVTEAIVLLIFLSRFKLDRQIQDLNESLENKQAIVQSYQNIEESYRDVQSKVSVLSKLIDSQTDWYSKINTFDEKVPTGITFKSVTYSSGEIDLSAEVDSPVVFGAFIQNLLADDSIRSVIINSSSYNSLEQTFSFSLTIQTDK